MFLIQMAGFPGSGKSSLAKEISKIFNAIILDIDVIKTALIESGIDSSILANTSYHTMFSLCDYYLSLNRNVIIDTPCYYTETLDNGTNLAKKYDAEYKYIECRLEDFEEVNRRLMSRVSKLSQWSSAEEDVFHKSFGKSKYPKSIKPIIVDSSLPISSYIQDIIEYINPK
ncbi:AAA family ATPase [Wukongibacter baidiensis]|uniref:AAA family ATPase n=1 Tax=Wukongibacter baidiensis TaxID=1723361 RepID=UPI003D7FB9D3